MRCVDRRAGLGRDGTRSLGLGLVLLLFKVVANVGNQPLFSCLTVGQNTLPWSVFFEEQSIIFLFNGSL